MQLPMITVQMFVAYDVEKYKSRFPVQMSQIEARHQVRHSSIVERAVTPR
jgi:hypothetical protein